MFKSKAEPWKEKRKGLSMDRKKITIRQNGRLVNLYDLIQSRNVDTEIYPTLQKYGSIKPMEITEEWLSTGLQTLESYKDIENLRKAAENLFLELPNEIQALYGNNYAEFEKDKGEKVKKYIKGKKNNEPDNNPNDIADNTKDN